MIEIHRRWQEIIENNRKMTGNSKFDLYYIPYYGTLDLLLINIYIDEKILIKSVDCWDTAVFYIYLIVVLRSI